MLQLYSEMAAHEDWHAIRRREVVHSGADFGVPRAPSPFRDERTGSFVVKFQREVWRE